MSHSKRGAALFTAALAAICGFAGVARAGSPAPAVPADTPLYLADVVTPAAAETAFGQRPLMSLLGDSGIGQSLKDARINIYGHVEGSWTHNFSGSGKIIPGRLFDLENDDPTLNQISLNVERTVIRDASNFDWGFRVEMLYGGDARFTHANGGFDNHEDDNRLGPDEQFDLLQAYADFNLPVANGLRVRAGKFTYFKVIDPEASPLYSRSFSFGSALPFTLTGAYATYVVNDDVQADFGISRGWDQSLEDNNAAIDVFGGVRYKLGDATNVAIKAILGPELEGNSGAYRFAIDATVSQKMSDQLTLIGNGIIGHQFDGDPADPFSDAWWYGVSGYAIYDISSSIQLNGRVEWYRDEDGATVTGGPSANLYSATVGVTVTPFPNDHVLNGLKIRPEVRYDYASKAIFGTTGAHPEGTEFGQFTGALEAYFAF